MSGDVVPSDLCGQCGQPSATVVVTVNGWVLDVCGSCARGLVDPLLPEVSR